MGLIPSVFEIFKKRDLIRKVDLLVVMSPCHVLVIALKYIVHRPIILDAGWPLTDGLISRGIRKSQIHKLLGSTLIDFMSFHFADIVLAESQAQLSRISKHFFIRKSKIFHQFTGLNESGFVTQQSDSAAISQVKKRVSELDNTLTVIFRGKINRESGFGNVLDAARLLDGVATFIFVSGGNLENFDLPKNVISVAYISEFEMKEIYLLSDIAVGQVSSHRRLNYTIPHKAFEAGYFSMPYITADSAGIREFLSLNSAIFLEESSGGELAKAIVTLKKIQIRKKFSREINSVYQKNASQKVLSTRFEQIVMDFWKARESRSY